MACNQPTFTPASLTGASGITSGELLQGAAFSDVGGGTAATCLQYDYSQGSGFDVTDLSDTRIEKLIYTNSLVSGGDGPGFRVVADGAYHGATTLTWTAASSLGGANASPTRDFVFDINYLPPTWDQGSTQSLTVGTTSSLLNLSRDSADNGDEASFIKLVFHPSLEIRTESGALIPNNTWVENGGGVYNNILNADGVTVKCHAHGTPTIVAYLAKDGSGTAASTGATLTITATLAVDPALPTDAARVTAWDFGSANTVASEANGGKPGWCTLRVGTSWMKQVGSSGSGFDSGDCYSTGSQCFIGGIGTDRGITVHGYSGVCDYPGGTSIGDVSTINPYANGDVSFNGGYTITPNAVSWLFVFSHTVRGTDSIGGEGLACVLLRMKDVINLQASAENYLQIAGTGVPGGPINVTVGGKKQYAHAGRNAVCLICNGTSLYVVTENGVSAAITITGGLATFSIDQCNLFNGAAGRSYSRGHYLLLSGAITTAKGQEYVNDFAKVRWGIVPKTKLGCWTGDSRSNRLLGKPGYTLAGDRATAHPDEMWLNFSQAGAATVTGGPQSVIDLQAPRAVAAIADIGMAENTWVHYGAANDILGSRTAANINADYTTLAGMAHGAGATFVTFTEPIFAVSHGSDANLVAYETVVRGLKTLLLANTDLDDVVDLAGLFPLLRAASNTSTNIRNAMRGDGSGSMDVQTYYRAPSAAVITAIKFVSDVGVATDGVHMGDDGQAIVFTMAETPITNALAASGAGGGAHRTSLTFRLGTMLAAGTLR